MKTYRLHDHTTADDASRYENKEHRANAEKHEPLARLEKYLASKNKWDEMEQKTHEEKVKDDIEHAVQEYLNLTPEQPSSMFTSLYQDTPHELRRQIETEFDYD